MFSNKIEDLPPKPWLRVSAKPYFRIVSVQYAWNGKNWNKKRRCSHLWKKVPTYPITCRRISQTRLGMCTTIKWSKQFGPNCRLKDLFETINVSPIKVMKSSLNQHQKEHFRILNSKKKEQQLIRIYPVVTSFSVWNKFQLNRLLIILLLSSFLILSR